MFAGKTLWQIFASGGVTMYVLLFCSLLSLAVIIDRLWVYWSMRRVNRAAFMRRIQAQIERKDREGAIEVCRETNAPFARVALAGLEARSRDEKLLASTLERAVTVQASKLERLTSIVGTIGNTAVYIGLFGTVLGIIRAFRDISAMGTGGMAIVIGGVAEALITTATGLAVAVPSVIAYNYFVRRIDGFVNDMELCASEMTDLLTR
ncbi:MAG TPA: MotA/TolQ/ExbB proton channel family protein [Spirochaetia bacterium]|nr:MotA/TolQ/ExbB proton channel family protein [Spirochaetia bacterium]